MTTVFGCDIFLNDVGVSISQYAVQAVVIGNGIDRNSYEGITVYDGDTHQIMGNCLHTNGQAATNTYGHIDVASGVTQVGIASNTFGPLDGGYSNLPSYCVVTHANPSIGAISATSGSWTPGPLRGPDYSCRQRVPAAGGSREDGRHHPGQPGEDVLRLVRSGGSVVFKMTQGGVAVWSSPFQMTPQASPEPVSGEGVLYVSSTDNGPHYIAPSGAGGADVSLVSGAFLCSPTQYAPSQAVTTQRRPPSQPGRTAARSRPLPRGPRHRPVYSTWHQQPDGRPREARSMSPRPGRLPPWSPIPGSLATR